MGGRGESIAPARLVAISKAPTNGVSESAEPEALDRNPERVRGMFDRIARRYDLANHLLSAGLDFRWRNRAAALVRQWHPRRVLDLATGSGDLALTIAKKLPGAEITGADFSSEMLAIARAKGLTNTAVADALDLPFSDQTFDAVTVAFGLRNMQNWDAALREMARVLTAGGYLLVLDFSLPRGILRPIYRSYLHHILPRIARLVTGEKGAYEYLGASIEKFPSGATMCALLEGSGFRDATAEPLSGGIVTIYSATRRPA